MSAQELEAIKKYLDEHLAKGFIRPSSSSAVAPILLARKPGGGIRVSMYDYHGLMQVTSDRQYSNGYTTGVGEVTYNHLERLFLSEKTYNSTCKYK